MTHIGQESRLQTIWFFSFLLCRNQIFFHFLSSGYHERRTYQSNRITFFIPLIHSGLSLNPFITRYSILMNYHAIFFSDLRNITFRQLLISSLYPVSVFLTNFGKILVVGYGKLLLVHHAIIMAKLYRTVYVTKHSTFLQIPFPGNNISHVQRHW